MMDARWSQLRQILVHAGWVWRDDTLYAPHETLWFTTSSDGPNFAQFRDCMTEAATTNPDELELAIDQDALRADLASLVAALDAVLDGN
jgi:hypothetical protein